MAPKLGNEAGLSDGNGTGGVVWRLGPEGDFALVNGNAPDDWFYNQHYPVLLELHGPSLSLAIFDNGDQRVGADGNAICCYSRPVLMQVDESSMTATLHWTPHVTFSA